MGLEFNHQMVVEDLQYLLKKVIDALGKQDIIQLQELSDNTIHNASIFQDADSLQFAVIVYALSKILTRTGGKTRTQFTASLELALKRISERDAEGYRNAISEVMDTISNINEEIRSYVMHVLEESQIKKGSRLYEHGISLATTADLMGVSQWEMMNYVGKTNIADKAETGKHTPARLALARELFKGDGQ